MSKLDLGHELSVACGFGAGVHQRDLREPLQ